MLKFKNLLCCTMSVILMLSLMSCSVVEKLNSHYEGELVIDQTENVSVSETVIKALENNDADAIKNLFSVRAKDLCPDLDEGIGYMLSIYEGEFVEVMQNNSSSNKYSSGGERCIVSPVCVFKTTENYYKLTWNAWTINEKDKEKEGVYSMKLQIWPDDGLDQGGEDLSVAGVVYPANSEESDMAFTLWKNIYQQKNHDDRIERFRELLSDNMLASGVTDDEIDRFFDYCQPMRELYEGWTEIDDGNITVYITSMKNDTPICFCFRLDKEQTDKISFLKFAEIDDEKTIGDYNLSEENAGIYLPD